VWLHLFRTVALVTFALLFSRLSMQAIDADVIVGHNISAFDLQVLLARMQHHKVRLPITNYAPLLRYAYSGPCHMLGQTPRLV
jgi:hypothetical protein